MSTRTSIAGLFSSAPQAFLQGHGDARRHEIVDLTPKGGQFPDAARGQEAVLGRAHQVDGLDVGCLKAVELVHLELVFEVRDRPQALDDRARVVLLRELDDEVRDRKSTRLNSSHVAISYAVFC